MMIWKRETAAVISLLLWCGCFGAPPHRYGGIAADLPKPGVAAVAVATLDRREYVLLGTLVDTSLFYDVEIQIFDGSGRRLAAERFEGEDDLGGRHWYPSGHAAEAIAPAVKARIEQFFEAPTIRAALQT